MQLLDQTKNNCGDLNTAEASQDQSFATELLLNCPSIFHFLALCMLFCRLLLSSPCPAGTSRLNLLTVSDTVVITNTDEL